MNTKEIKPKEIELIKLLHSKRPKSGPKRIWPFNWFLVSGKYLDDVAQSRKISARRLMILNEV